MTVAIIIGIVVLIGLWFMGTYNSLVRLYNAVKEAFSGMDIYLKKRFDLIPNLVETVKGYAAHESGTLEKIILARQGIQKAGDNMDERLASENQLTTALRGLNVVVEQYPNLKADTQFLDLQRQLAQIENDIAQARKYYNGTVRAYNTKVESFPTMIVANISGKKAATYFEVSDEAERQNVQVKF